MADSTPVSKAVHVFAEGGKDDSAPQYGTHFAFTHGLGTADIFVSARSATGEPIAPSTSAQDDNVAVVSRKDGHRWHPGDRILVMG